MIWLDKTPRSIVVGCSRCPSFRALASDPAEAERAAQRHLHSCHDDTAATRRAVTASRARQRRSDTP